MILSCVFLRDCNMMHDEYTRSAAPATMKKTKEKKTKKKKKQQNVAMLQLIYLRSGRTCINMAEHKFRQTLETHQPELCLGKIYRNCRHYCCCICVSTVYESDHDYTNRQKMFIVASLFCTSPKTWRQTCIYCDFRWDCASPGTQANRCVKVTYIPR